MKKVFYSIVLILLGFYPLFAQQSYYYCQGKRVFLPENEFVRYVRLKNTLSESQIKIIQEELSSCCSKVYEYNPFLSKYFILEDKIEQFNDVISSNDTSVCLNSSNCASNDTLTFYPSRTILVKVKPSTSLMPVLDSIGVPYINIVQSRYNAQEYKISLSSDVALRCAALL